MQHLRWTALVLVALAACKPAVDYDFQRVRFDHSALETLEAAGVARPGIRMDMAGGSLRADLRAVAAGTLSLSLAPVGDAAYGSIVKVELREKGWRSSLGMGYAGTCILRWGAPGIPMDAPWQDCSFDIVRPIEDAELTVKRVGAGRGEVFVSEPRLEGRRTSEKPHVFILLLDAARFDMLRPFREGAPLGTHLEKLAADSVVLRRMHSSTSWTRPAVATLFTGLRADRHRVQERGDVMTEGLVTLPEILRDSGWSTTAWSTNPNVLPLWGLAQGFDVFMDMGSKVWASDKTDGAEVLSRLRAALSVRGPQATFWYMHLMDPHGPYRPSSAQRDVIRSKPDRTSWFPRGPLNVMARPTDWLAFVDYMGEMLDSDEHVGNFVKLLKDEGLYDSSMVLVVADHGEEFTDHGGRDHGRTLYEEVLRVPALLKLPGNRLGGHVVEAGLSLEDLFPLLLDELGLPVPADIDGRLVELDDREIEGKPHVATLRLDGARQETILDGPWKLIVNEVRGTKELYKLDEDPKEERNVADLQPEVLKQLSVSLGLVLGHGQEGWHVLLCGTKKENSMDLEVQTGGASPEWFGFDPEEATLVSQQQNVWRLRPRLVPRSVEDSVLGALAMQKIPDHAEMLIPDKAEAPAPLVIRSAAPMEFRLGISGVVQVSRELRLDAGKSDTLVVTGVRAACHPTPKPGVEVPASETPFVRVWYVPPVKTVADEHLDPALRERLKALGYLQ